MRKKVLILVKTYPNPSHKYQESVCVAGVKEDDKDWIRLYPVRFRSLDDEKRFKKYQWVEIDIVKSSDSRPYTYKPLIDTITIGDTIDSDNNWSGRKQWVYPLIVDSMCSVQAEANQCMEEGRPVIRSLAAFRPRLVEDIEVEKDSTDWTREQKEWMSQQGLFDKHRHPLEKVPYKFYYRYRCADERCEGHHQSIIDWEIMQLYRNLKHTGHNENKIISKIKEKWLTQMCGKDRDTIFFVGNGFQTPKSFMVIGVFYPKRTT
jgi:hypothetical protein